MAHTSANNVSAEDVLFGEVIASYTRKEALADGFQVDASIGDLAEVTRQHFKFPCYITQGLWAIMDRATANRRHMNDLRGIWHDVCYLGRQAIRFSRDPSVVTFRCLIKGAGRQSLYTIRVECGPVDIDDPRPALTFGMPEDF